MPAMVSVIIASYNKAPYVRETIGSVLTQTFSDLELIVVDDCSTDGTQNAISEFADPRLKTTVLSENHGANHCRNLGLSSASGRYVMFLDADDLLSPDCIERRMKAADRNPDVNLFVFSMGVFHKQVGDDKRTWTPGSKRPLKDFLQHRLPWSILQPFWRRDFLMKLSGFDPSFERLQDVEL